MEKGALGVLEVTGDERPDIFRVLTAGSGGTGVSLTSGSGDTLTNSGAIGGGDGGELSNDDPV